MDEIIVPVEKCNHYINRLHEITDEIATVRNELEEARQIVELNWEGESGQASMDVINRFDAKFKDIDNSLSEIMTVISGLSVADNENA